MRILANTILLSVGILTASAAKTGAITLSNTYEDCVLLESLMDCTDCDDGIAHGSYYPYDKTPLDDYYQDYELVTCSFPGQCPDGTVKNSCSWQRYLYFQCEFYGETHTFLSTGTNSLPNHCYF